MSTKRCFIKKRTKGDPKDDHGLLKISWKEFWRDYLKKITIYYFLQDHRHPIAFYDSLFQFLRRFMCLYLVRFDRGYDKLLYHPLCMCPFFHNLSYYKRYKLNQNGTKLWNLVAHNLKQNLWSRFHSTLVKIYIFLILKSQLFI